MCWTFKYLWDLRGCFNKNNRLSDRVTDHPPMLSGHSRMVRGPVGRSVVLIEPTPWFLNQWQNPVCEWCVNIVEDVWLALWWCHSIQDFVCFIGECGFWTPCHNFPSCWPGPSYVDQLAFWAGIDRWSYGQPWPAAQPTRSPKTNHFCSPEKKTIYMLDS